MSLKFSTDQGAAGKSALGMIVLENDETLEAEIRQVFNQDGVVVYHARIPSQPDITTETLLEMKQDLPACAALLPTNSPIKVIAYACTSGATLIGEDAIQSAIRQSHPQALATDPMRAVIAAFNHLNVKNIGLLTPYIPAVSSRMVEHLEKNGFHINGFQSFEQSQERVVARITPQSVYQAICQLGQSDRVECVFASCTNLRSFDIIDKAEQKIGKPVISSNQALAWHMLKRAGLSHTHTGPGRLFVT